MTLKSIAHIAMFMAAMIPESVHFRLAHSSNGCSATPTGL
jgi:hypothetical protein